MTDHLDRIAALMKDALRRGVPLQNVLGEFLDNLDAAIDEMKCAGLDTATAMRFRVEMRAIAERVRKAAEREIRRLKKPRRH